MASKNRMLRIDDEILKELSTIIRLQLNDPRVTSMLSVVKVETSSDLSHCNVYVSVFGDDKQKEKAIEGLISSQGFIRKLIAKRINLRLTPKFNFILDETLEHAARMSKLIDENIKPVKE